MRLSPRLLAFLHRLCRDWESFNRLFSTNERFFIIFLLFLHYFFQNFFRLEIYYRKDFSERNFDFYLSFHTENGSTWFLPLPSPIASKNGHTFGDFRSLKCKSVFLEKFNFRIVWSCFSVFGFSGSVFRLCSWFHFWQSYSIIHCNFAL